MKVFNLFKKNKAIFSHQNSILVNSIPKAGTNLLLNLATSIPNTIRKGDCSHAQRFPEPESRFKYIMQQIPVIQPGNVFSGHIPYFKIYDNWLSEKKIKQLFIYRDPRAVLVSAYFFVLEMKKEKHINYNLIMHGTNREDKMLDLIYGFGEGTDKLIINEKSLPGIRTIYEAYLPWLNNKNTYAIKYEDLISENEKYTSEILNFLNFKTKEELHMANFIYKKGSDPSNSHTFRKGGIEEWKKEFTGQREIAFKEVMPESLMKSFGYKI